MKHFDKLLKAFQISQMDREIFLKKFDLTE